MPDLMSMREIVEEWNNPSASVISNEEQTNHMYTCPKCASWSHQDTLFTDYFSCVQCGYETHKVHHVVLRKSEEN